MRILLLAILSHLAVCGIGSAQSPATKTPAKPDADAKDPKETTEAKSLSSAKDLIAAVPRETLAHLRPGPRMEEALSQANSAMMTRFKGKSATLRLKFDSAKKVKVTDNPDEFSVVSVERSVDSAGNIFTIHTTVHVPEKQGDSVKKLKKGAEFTASGELGKAEYAYESKKKLMTLNIDINKASIGGK